MSGYFNSKIKRIKSRLLNLFENTHKPKIFNFYRLGIKITPLVEAKLIKRSKKFGIELVAICICIGSTIVELSRDMFKHKHNSRCEAWYQNCTVRFLFLSRCRTTLPLPSVCTDDTPYIKQSTVPVPTMTS